MAIQFDGVNDKVTWATAPLTDSLTTMTYAIRLQPSSFPGTENDLVSKTTPGSQYYWRVATIPSSGKGILDFVRKWSGSFATWRNTNSSDNLIASTEYDFVVTYDGGSTSNDPLFYINGASVPVSRIVAPSGSLSSDAGSSLLLGDLGDGASWFAGIERSVCLYNRIASASEILDWHNSKLAIPDKRGLVFAPQLASNGQVGEGGTLAAGNTFADAVSGALGVCSGSPLFRGDRFLTFQN